METKLRGGCGNDWLYIDSLRKSEGKSLGFIPKDAYLSVLESKRLSNRERFRYQDILLTLDDEDTTGFCYVSYSGDYCKVIQIVVQQDARRWERATMLLTEIEDRAKKRGNLGVMCRVAYDLESNWFWLASGYYVVNKVVSTWLNQKESKSKRPLLVYQKCFSPLFEANV